MSSIKYANALIFTICTSINTHTVRFHIMLADKTNVSDVPQGYALRPIEFKHLETFIGHFCTALDNFSK